MNSLEFIKQHVTEWPGDNAEQVILCTNGTIVFSGRTSPTPCHTVDLSEHFAPSYYDGKVWTREEFEAPARVVPNEPTVTISSNKYERELTDRQGNSATIDVYDVLQAFNVTCPATQHAVKKLLCTGIRGHKDTTTDLIEARESITRAIELQG